MFNFGWSSDKSDEKKEQESSSAADATGSSSDKGQENQSGGFYGQSMFSAFFGGSQKEEEKKPLNPKNKTQASGKDAKSAETPDAAGTGVLTNLMKFGASKQPDADKTPSKEKEKSPEDATAGTGLLTNLMKFKSDKPADADAAKTSAKKNADKTGMEEKKPADKAGKPTPGQEAGWGFSSLSTTSQAKPGIVQNLSENQLFLEIMDTVSVVGTIAIILGLFYLGIYINEKYKAHLNLAHDIAIAKIHLRIVEIKRKISIVQRDFDAATIDIARLKAVFKALDNRLKKADESFKAFDESSAGMPLYSCNRPRKTGIQELLNGLTVRCFKGWTIFHRNIGYSTGFEWGWEKYKNGFGDLTGDNYWLGNENLHKMTSIDLCKLRIDIWDANNASFVAYYNFFYIKSESDYYRMKVRDYDRKKSSISDGLIAALPTEVHNEMAFSTKDRDHDTVLIRNCGAEFFVGWWYNSCYKSNLNNPPKSNRATKQMMWDKKLIEGSSMMFKCL